MYRLVDCDTWGDSWFEALAPHGKLFFLYLLTNPRSTSCGAFELTPRKMAFETGLDQADIERWLVEWSPRVRWWPQHGIVWIKNFYRRQPGAASEKTRINAERLVAQLPRDVQEAVAMEYPQLVPSIDRASIGHQYGSDHIENDKENENDRDLETDSENEPDAPAVPIVGSPATVEQPFAMWTAFCAAAEYDIGAATPQAKGKSLATAKRMLAAGVTVAEVTACTGYLRSQSWRTGLLSLTTVEAEIGQWRMAGRPGQERARASPKTVPISSEVDALRAKYAAEDQAIDATWRPTR